MAKKFEVVFTRTETYSYRRVVEANCKSEAIMKLEADTSWEYPDEYDNCEVDSDAKEVA